MCVSYLYLQIQSITTYYPITMPAGISVIVISVVLIVAGVVEPILFLANFVIAQQVEHRYIYGVTCKLSTTVSYFMQACTYN